MSLSHANFAVVLALAWLVPDAAAAALDAAPPSEADEENDSRSPAARPPTTPPPPPSRATPPPAPSPIAEPGPEDAGDGASTQDLSGTWGYSRTSAQAPRYVRTDNPAVYASPNPIGFYSGVSVAGNHVPPRPPAEFDSRPATLTWAGFERATEGSRVFFQLNAEAQYSVEHNGLTMTIRLRNTKVNVRNNTRALDLRYFNTPVRTVAVKRRGKDTTATIVLKRQADPQVQLVTGKAGYKLLVVQFSDAVEATAKRAAPTDKPTQSYDTGYEADATTE